MKSACLKPRVAAVAMGVSGERRQLPCYREIAPSSGQQGPTPPESKLLSNEGKGPIPSPSSFLCAIGWENPGQNRCILYLCLGYSGHNKGSEKSCRRESCLTTFPQTSLTTEHPRPFCACECMCVCLCVKNSH